MIKMMMVMVMTMMTMMIKMMIMMMVLTMIIIKMVMIMKIITGNGNDGDDNGTNYDNGSATTNQLASMTNEEREKELLKNSNC